MVREPLSAAVDPDGVLARIAEDEWVHTEDNKVSYFRAHCTTEGKAKYTANNPGEFKGGDLVEAQISVIAVKRRGRNKIYSLKLVLRAITLLDDGLTRTARTKRIQDTARLPMTPVRGIKRTAGYLDEEEDGQVPTSKMKRLTVNEVEMAEYE
ncbi:hypothetical protein HWV62_21068 [Athelia sp. TMB]|nr:hypothetical protein HWV62_21068 [Athelia sp. TMB]